MVAEQDITAEADRVDVDKERWEDETITKNVFNCLVVLRK